MKWFLKKLFKSQRFHIKKHEYLKRPLTNTGNNWKICTAVQLIKAGKKNSQKGGAVQHSFPTGCTYTPIKSTAEACFTSLYTSPKCYRSISGLGSMLT